MVFCSSEGSLFLREISRDGVNYVFSNCKLFSTLILVSIEICSISFEGICFIDTDSFCGADLVKSVLCGGVLLVGLVSERDKRIKVYGLGLALILGFKKYAFRALKGSLSDILMLSGFCQLVIKIRSVS